MKDVLQVGMETEAGEELAVTMVSSICPTKPPAISSLIDEVAEKFLLEVDVDNFAGLPSVLQDFATIRQVLQPESDLQFQTSLNLATAAQKVVGGKRAVGTVLSAFALSKFGKGKLKDVAKAIEMNAVAKAKSSAADHVFKAVQELHVKHGCKVSSATFCDFDSTASVLAVSSGTTAMAKSALDILTAFVASVMQDFAKLIDCDSEQLPKESYTAIADMQDVFTSLEKSWRTWHTETQQKIIQDDESYATCPVLQMFCAT